MRRPRKSPLTERDTVEQVVDRVAGKVSGPDKAQNDVDIVRHVWPIRGNESVAGLCIRCAQRLSPVLGV